MGAFQLAMKRRPGYVFSQNVIAVRTLCCAANIFAGLLPFVYVSLALELSWLSDTVTAPCI
jgi:hypothetical protein